MRRAPPILAGTSAAEHMCGRAHVRPRQPPCSGGLPPTNPPLARLRRRRTGRLLSLDKEAVCTLVHSSHPLRSHKTRRPWCAAAASSSCARFARSACSSCARAAGAYLELLPLPQHAHGLHLGGPLLAPAPLGLLLHLPLQSRPLLLVRLDLVLQLHALREREQRG